MSNKSCSLNLFKVLWHSEFCNIFYLLALILMHSPSGRKDMFVLLQANTALIDRKVTYQMGESPFVLNYVSGVHSSSNTTNII